MFSGEKSAPHSISGFKAFSRLVDNDGTFQLLWVHLQKELIQRHSTTIRRFLELWLAFWKNVFLVISDESEAVYPFTHFLARMH